MVDAAHGKLRFYP